MNLKKLKSPLIAISQMSVLKLRLRRR
jgi:hypothetical protein